MLTQSEYYDRGDYFNPNSIFATQVNCILTDDELNEQYFNQDYVFRCNFTINDRDLYISMRGKYLPYDHIYDNKDEIITGRFLLADGESFANPRGLFLVGDYLYYNYGKDKEMNDFTLAGPNTYTRRDFKFAKISLVSMDTEKIMKGEYERELKKINGFYK